MSRGGDSIRICGLPAFFRCGMQYFDTMKVPRVLMFIIRSNRFMSVACESVRLMALALLMQMSMPPNSAAVCSTAATTCASSRISQRIGNGLRGNRDIDAVARRAQRDRKPDAATATGHEHRLALERCH